MRRITKFFLFLLVGLSLAGNFLNFGGLYLMNNTSDRYNKRDLRHWLSLQSRVEALEEAADVFAPSEEESLPQTPATEADTFPESVVSDADETKPTSETEIPLQTTETETGS